MLEILGLRAKWFKSIGRLCVQNQIGRKLRRNQKSTDWI